MDLPLITYLEYTVLGSDSSVYTNPLLGWGEKRGGGGAPGEGRKAHPGAGFSNHGLSYLHH